MEPLAGRGEHEIAIEPIGASRLGEQRDAAGKRDGRHDSKAPAHRSVLPAVTALRPAQSQASPSAVTVCTPKRRTNLGDTASSPPSSPRDYAPGLFSSMLAS